MLYLTLFPPYHSQLCHATFWVVLLAWALLSLSVIWWLRKGLERLEASRLLPVEYGTVTATSVLGGLVLYQEARYVGALNLALMGVGILLICCGCALVGRRKTMPKKYMPGSYVAHRMMPLVRSRVARRNMRHLQLADVAGPGLAEQSPTRNGAASPKPHARQDEEALHGANGHPQQAGEDVHAEESHHHQDLRV